MNKLIIFVVIALAVAFIAQPKAATPEQRIATIQSQIGKAADQAKPFVTSTVEKLGELTGQTQPAPVLHNSPIVHTERPISPRLLHMLEVEGGRQSEERKTDYERHGAGSERSETDAALIDFAMNYKKE